MQLEVNGTVIDAPLNGDVIEQAIFAMTGDSGSFVILSHNRMTYIQAAGGARTGFQLEYQEGSLEKHFSCSELDLSTSQVINAFQRYLAGDRRWKTELVWKHDDADAELVGAPFGVRAAVVCVLVGIAAVVLWKLLE